MAEFTDMLLMILDIITQLTNLQMMLDFIKFNQLLTCQIMLMLKVQEAPFVNCVGMCGLLYKLLI